MKRILTTALAILMIAALAIPSAAAEKIGANAAKVAVTVSGVSTETPKLDGKIGKYEYSEIKYALQRRGHRRARKEKRQDLRGLLV